MEPSTRHRLAEAHMRDLLDGAGLDHPDGVDYDATSVIFRWSGPKVAIVVDLEPVPGVVYDVG